MPAFSANARHVEQSAAARSAEPEVPRCDRCGRADRALTTDPTRARVAGHCARCSWVLLSCSQGHVVDTEHDDSCGWQAIILALER
jgi:hypothetical protein